MEIPPETTDAGSPAADAAAWDWGSLFELTLDDGFPLEPLDERHDPLLLPTLPPPPPSPAEPSPAPSLDPSPAIPSRGDMLGRVRKRDPRLVCPNYLAGVVPCSCPELDEMAAAAEAAAGTRKRVRMGGAAGTVSRCQVAGCEADISELKGYHKRHRVCLRCANASSVFIDGGHKRYCQQCGKFHILPDFDEDKRSCRRKLERHNKRRRRRTTDSKTTNEREMEDQEGLLGGADISGEPRKETSESASGGVETAGSSKGLDEDNFLGSRDGHGSPIGSLQYHRNDNPNSTLLFEASVSIKIVEKLTNSKSSFSSAPCMKNSAYSSMCPTGRISFKLYDWNPADFPRRLRHQIFQWLQNMPVELEDYIRPGCTILTVFIAMPQFMWEELSEDMVDKLRDLVNAPESLLMGRDPFLIYLSDMIVWVERDGTSFMNVKMEMQTPRLHFVYPAYFEAGKNLEFYVCGSNLEQPKLRFLVSFAGKYLKCDCSRIRYPGKIGCHDEKGTQYMCSNEHEVFWVRISCTDSKVLGPAFVEVDNVSGISNFIPILVGNKNICSELERMEEGLGHNFISDGIKSQNVVTTPGPCTCECVVSKQRAMSALLLDIGWFLKDPNSDQNQTFLSSTNIKRMGSLLEFLTKNKLSSVFDVITTNLENIIDPDGLTENQDAALDADLLQLHRYIENAREIIHQRYIRQNKSEVKGKSLLRFLTQQCYLNADVLGMLYGNQSQNKKVACGERLGSAKLQSAGDVNTPLVPKGVVRNQQRCYVNSSIKHDLGNSIPPLVTRTRLVTFVMVIAVMCLVACVVILLRPHQAGWGALAVLI